jgi:dTMP kinase
MGLKSRGLLITFEGLEGSGKTTQLKKLADALREEKYPVVATHEPGGTPIGVEIRKLIMGTRGGKISGETELFLYMADRAHHVRNLLVEAMHKKQIVLCDRFADSTIAYQAFGRNLPERLLDAMNKVATGGLEPDLTFFLDLPIKQGLKRVKKRGSMNRMDHESAAFYNKVRQGYYFLARRNARFAILDATQSPDQIHAIIIQKVSRLLLQSRPDLLAHGRSRTK